MPSMKRFTANLLNRSKSSSDSVPRNSQSSQDPETPDGAASKSVRLFCESGAPTNTGEEVLHLPTIVEMCESSPQAATAATYQIRKYLSKDNYGKPNVQYNAIMLVRILCEHPGPSFTRNLDKYFVKTTKELLNNGRTTSVQQILRETLDFLEREKYQDENLKPLLTMWGQRKGSEDDGMQPRFAYRAPPAVPGVSSSNHRNHSRQQLPSPAELASRIEESKNTAKILLQLVQSTPPEEFVGNDLIKEFAERCQAAQRSMQGYINCDNPPPDDDTLQTLIEVNEQLSLSMSRYQRATLSARRANISSSRNQSPNIPVGGANSPPPVAENISQPMANDEEAAAAAAAAASPQPAQQSAPSTRFQRGYDRVSVSSSNGQAPQHGYSNGSVSSTGAPSPGIQSAELSSYNGASNPPSTIGSRLADRPSYSQQRAVSPELRQAEQAEPIQDPFGDHAESAIPHHMEPAPYGRDFPPQSSPREIMSSRPAIGAYHNGGVTTSYVGRQASAANGLTMRGADPVEVDTDSREGRLYQQQERVAELDSHPEEEPQPVVYRY